MSSQSSLGGGVVLVLGALALHSCAPPKVESAPHLLKDNCERGNAPDCSELAIELVDRTDESALAQARTAAHRGCELGNADACGVLAYLMVKRPGPSDTLVGAGKVAERACSDGSHFACVRFAPMYAIGASVPKDPVRAMSFWSLACKAGDPDSCLMLARGLFVGLTGSPDPTGAAGYYERACRQGAQEACEERANLGASPDEPLKIPAVCRGEEDPSEELEQKPVTHGLPKSVVDGVVDQEAWTIRYCYEVGLRIDPKLTGKVTVNFTIGCPGNVKSARISKNTFAPPFDGIASCMLEQVQRFRFPPPGSGEDVKASYPWDFSPAASP